MHTFARDSSVQILTGIDDIQVMLDDYLLRIQTMRGSPFVGAIESDIEVWEHKLILMQDILDQWLQVNLHTCSYDYLLFVHSASRVFTDKCYL